MHWSGLAALGTLIPASVVAGAALGWWLDGKLSTAPWLAVAGAALGAWAAFAQMMRMVRMTRGGE